MFKWILILFIGLLAFWTFGSSKVPNNLKESTFGKTLNSVIFELNYKVNASSPSSRKYDSQIVAVDDARLQSVLKSLNNTNRTAVIYFYDTNCFFCRFVLQDINRVAKENTDKNLVF